MANMTNATEMIAEIAEQIEAHNECLDTIWMLLAAMLVFFMHAGFSLLETGCVQYKNSQNILAKNLIVVTCGFICWYFFGWAIAFGPKEEPSEFIGSVGWAMDGFMAEGGYVNFRNWFFQGAFCATASTIVSGAIAERTKLTAFGIFIFIMTSFIYPVVIYWGWSGEGFLNKPDGTSAFGPGYMDFAGSGLVHMVGGVAALCGSAIVGPRKGRFQADTPEEAFHPHNVPFCVVGTFFLWFGWYGFNPGSTLQMHELGDAYSAGLVACNTTLAPCVGGLVVFGLRRFLLPPKALDVPGFCNGLLAGLVSITAGCGAVKCWEAMIIGGIGGLVYQGWSMTMEKLKLDDVVDAVAVHGACGVWGVLALGFFGDPDAGNGGNGLFYENSTGGEQLWVQFMAIVVIALWTAGWSIAIFLPLRLAGLLRLSDEFQDAGADKKEHSPSKGYILNEMH